MGLLSKIIESAVIQCITENISYAAGSPNALFLVFSLFHSAACRSKTVGAYLVI